jgi:MFS family permease
MFLSVFSGTIVDRVYVKKLMFILLFIELLMTLAFLLINSLDDTILLLIFIFIRMGSASIFFTTEMTLLPKILKGEALIKANELHSIIWSLTFASGMAIGGIVVDLFGIKISFLIDASLFLIALLVLVQINFEVKKTAVYEPIFKSIKYGIDYIKANLSLLHYMFLHSVVGLTAFDTLITLLSDFHYKYIIAVSLAIGFTNMCRALGAIIGPIIISNWINRERLFHLFIFQAISIIIWAYIQYDFYLGLFGMFLTGLTTTTLWSFTYAMLQEKVEEQYLGRVLAYNEMIFMSMIVFVTFFIGFMAEIVELRTVTLILGFSFFIVAYYYKVIFLKD